MITIKTRLHDGIYKSCGGGQTVTHYRWRTTTARTLLAACKTLDDHAESMWRRYGDVGAGRSWIDMDGVLIDLWDAELVQDTRDAQLTIRVEAVDSIGRAMSVV